ncbi:helix-turn-helix transcriptional regulator [Sedimentibacter hydroxybenzoicus DSM 7310]|uniref:Helix-turn-helix transcriptional regulator n=1 Tax=Sedimentibacter hydroxybenzoicus DSM 7310 TaxID=1123245 RepID=A0A974BHB8_SEDHY|nr:helix-turn-helix transcriptional regulator [Sedimentibacter hydroxybenzoicus]NYB73108.1 helix-turn-helix transcriptional regulator [Sedimentibacter hydroxybenzoicus DSM 7310]
MFSENLKNLRKQKGLSQEELAERLHIVRQTVSKWEKGLSVPDADLLIRIAEIFEVSVSVLLGDTIELSDKEEGNIIAQKLEQLNSLLAEKNRRSRRIWKTVKIVLLSFTVIILLLLILNFSAFQKLGESSTVTTEQNAQITEVNKTERSSQREIN